MELKELTKHDLTPSYGDNGSYYSTKFCIVYTRRSDLLKVCTLKNRDFCVCPCCMPFLHTLYANFVHFACYSSKSALVEGLFNVITRMWIMSMKLIVAIKYTSHVHELLNPSYFHMALIQVWYGPVPVSLGEIPHETLTKSRMPQMTWYLPYHTRNSVFDCDDGMMSSQASRILLKVVVLTHPLVVYRPSSNSQVLLNSLSL